MGTIIDGGDGRMQRRRPLHNDSALLITLIFISWLLWGCTGQPKAPDLPQWNPAANRILVLVSGMGSQNPYGDKWLDHRDTKPFTDWSDFLQKVDGSRYREVILLSHTTKGDPRSAYSPEDACVTVHAANNAVALIQAYPDMTFDFVGHSLGGAAIVTAMAITKDATIIPQVHAVVGLSSPVIGEDSFIAGLGDMMCPGLNQLVGSLDITLMAGAIAKARTLVDIYLVGNRNDMVVPVSSSIVEKVAGTLTVEVGTCAEKAFNFLTKSCPAHEVVRHDSNVLNWVVARLNEDGKVFASRRLPDTVSGSPATATITAKTLYADIGDPKSETTFGLQGWDRAEGPGVNPYTSPTGDRTKRFQRLRGDNSLTFTGVTANLPYRLTTEVEDGNCTDNFQILINNTPLYRFNGDHGMVVRIHTFSIPANIVTTERLIVTYRNLATDNCGLAAVFNLRLESVTNASASRSLFLESRRASPGLDTTIDITIGQHLTITASGMAGYGNQGVDGPGGPDAGAPCVGRPLTDPDGNRQVNGVPCRKRIDPAAALPT